MATFDFVYKTGTVLEEGSGQREGIRSLVQDSRAFVGPILRAMQKMGGGGG